MERNELLEAVLKDLFVKAAADQRKEVLSNCPKTSNFYNYHLTGDENIYEKEDGKFVVEWSDGTETSTELHSGDERDSELALLICFAKKFVKGLDLDKLYSIVKDNKDIKVILKQMIRATAGKNAINNIQCWVESEQEAKELDELYERQEAKRLARRKKRFEKIEELKKKGLWVSVNDLRKLEIENEQLKSQLERKQESSLAQKFKELQEENKKLKDELKK